MLTLPRLVGMNVRAGAGAGAAVGSCSAGLGAGRVGRIAPSASDGSVVCAAPPRVRGRGSGSWLGKQIGMNRCKFGTVSKVLAIRLVDTCIYSTFIYIYMCKLHY